MTVKIPNDDAELLGGKNPAARERVSLYVHNRLISLGKLCAYLLYLRSSVNRIGGLVILIFFLIILFYV